MADTSDDTLFPPLTRDYMLAFQFSSWYPIFAAHSIKSTIIRPLSAEFREYLNADGVFVPEGSEDAPAESTLSDDEKDPDADEPPPESDTESESADEEDDDDDDETDTRRKHYAFPELDARIRECIAAYDAVFPKLNFTSPRDAAWLLPASSPLKCTAPADVYLLLKSSDFVTHDLSPEAVFEGASSVPGGGSSEAPYELELVLRKWYAVDRSRELRCFVRDDVLLAISQRDTNFYEFWNEPATQDRVRTAVRDFWETQIRPNWPAGVQRDYTFDLLLTRDLTRAHIVDFNPYARKTDALLFAYEELGELHHSHRHQNPRPNHVQNQTVGEAVDNPPQGEKNQLERDDKPDQEKDEHQDAASILNDKDRKEPGPASPSPSVSTVQSLGQQTQAQAHGAPPPPSPPELPILRVIDSASHPAATSNAPAHQHNMVPFEAISLSSGRDIEEFADTWQASVKESMRGD